MDYIELNPIAKYQTYKGGIPFLVIRPPSGIPISIGGTGASSLPNLASSINAYTNLSSLGDVSITSTPSNGQSLVFSASINKFICSTISGVGGAGVTDHGALTGLSDDDHPQYVLSATNNTLSSNVSNHIASASVHFTANSLSSSPGYVLSSVNTNLSSLVSNLQIQTINFVIDGGGATITAGVKGDISFDFNATILSATLLADQSGSIVIDLWKDTYANFPPTVADTITASAKPTLSTATKNRDGTLTGWTTSISANDIIRVNVDSATTCQRVTLALTIRRT